MTYIYDVHLHNYDIHYTFIIAFGAPVLGYLQLKYAFVDILNPN